MVFKGDLIWPCFLCFGPGAGVELVRAPLKRTGQIMEAGVAHMGPGGMDAPVSPFSSLPTSVSKTEEDRSLQQLHLLHPQRCPSPAACPAGSDPSREPASSPACAAQWPRVPGRPPESAAELRDTA